MPFLSRFFLAFPNSISLSSNVHLAEDLWLKVSVSKYDGYLYIAPETEPFLFI